MMCRGQEKGKRTGEGQVEHSLQKNGMTRGLEAAKDMNHGVNTGRLRGRSLRCEAGDESGEGDKPALYGVCQTA